MGGDVSTSTSVCFCCFDLYLRKYITKIPETPPARNENMSVKTPNTARLVEHVPALLSLSSVSTSAPMKTKCVNGNVKV